MPKFSDRSKRELATCHIDLQNLFNEVIKVFDCTVLEGHRDQERQDELFRTGFSKAQYPNSRHNIMRSEAVDVVPYPIDWNDIKRFYFFGGYVLAKADQMDIKIRWGGDWDGDKDINDQKFNDLVHWELLL